MGVLYTLSNDHVASYNRRTKFFDRIKIGNTNSYFYDFTIDVSSGTLFISDCRNSAIHEYNARHKSPGTIGAVVGPTYIQAGLGTPYLFVVSEVSKFMTMVNYKSIFVIRLQDNKVIATLPSPRNPVKLAVSADCRTVYVVDHEKGSAAYALYKIDVEAKTISGSLALNGPVAGMCISPDGRMVYLSMVGQGKVLVVNSDGLTVSGEILVQDSNGRIYELRDIVLSPDGTKLYAATGTKAIAVIGLENRAPLTFIQTSFNASTMAIDAAENLLYVACALLDLLVIDMPTDRIIRRMTMEQGVIKKILVGPS